MAHRVFSCQRRVNYADCTAGNHVYHSRYLDMAEQARGEFFRNLGQPFLAWQETGVIFPVVEATLRYCAPARYDDLLESDYGSAFLGVGISWRDDDLKYLLGSVPTNF